MKKKILAVDNNLMVLEFMKGLLTKEGHDVLTAEDGLGALDILKTFTPDIIFVDRIMPNIEGEKLCQIIRTIPELKDVCLVILSAIAVEEEIDLTKSGANAYIAKAPFKKMGQYILDMVDKAERVKDLKEEIVGLEDVFPREITEELLSTKRHFEVTLGKMLEGILEVDSDKRIVYANPAAISLIGIAEEQLLGTVFSELFRGRDRERVEGLLEIIDVEREPVTEESPLNLSDKLVSMSILGVSGKDHRYIIILHDITEHKRAEEALRASEKRFRMLFEKSRDAILITTRDGNHVDVNQAALDLFGYTREEIMSMNAKERYANPDFRTRIREEIENRGYVQDYEVDYRRKDGTKMECLSTSTVRRDDHGNILGFQTIVRDVTEQKRMQAQLLQAQKMEAIGVLAGGVAHDLNNVLGSLTAYPDLLLRKLPEESNLRKPLITMKEAGEKAATIVHDMLTLARRGVTISEVVNLSNIVSEYLRSPEHEKLKQFHPEARIESSLEPDLLNILGSPVHLYKTVMNLVSNAAEAMPDGGDILIVAENRYIDRPTKGYDDLAEGDYVTLTVSDTGIGISAKDKERIFEPFYTKKVMGRSGTGLGMAVVWGTVKDHKGYIDVQSQEGKGTVFTLYFPITREEIKVTPPPSIEEHKGKGESILVVDDVEEQRQIASFVLQELNYSVTTVASGEKAVGYLKKHKVDLLILDMIMDPSIDGLETYKRIVKVRPGQKAIITSGFSETDRVREAQRLGAGAYVKKPYTLEKLGLAVRAELDK